MTANHKVTLQKLEADGLLTAAQATHYRSLTYGDQAEYYRVARGNQQGLANNERRLGGGHSTRDYQGPDRF